MFFTALPGADLNDVFESLGRIHHRLCFDEAVGDRLFAVDILARIYRVNDDSFVPVIRDGRHNAVDFFVVEQILVVSRNGQIRTRDFARKSISAVVKVAGGSAVDTGEVIRGIEEG